MSTKIYTNSDNFHSDELKFLTEHIRGKYDKRGFYLANGTIELIIGRKPREEDPQKPKYYLLYKSKYLSGLFLESRKNNTWCYRFDFPVSTSNDVAKYYFYSTPDSITITDRFI